MKYVKTIKYSRPMGYIAPTINFNAGKQSEFNDRKTYNIEMINQEVKNIK